MGASDGCDQIGFQKVLALEQQWQVAQARQGIGRAVPQVQTGRITRRASSSCSIRSKARAARICSGVISMIDCYHERSDQINVPAAVRSRRAGNPGDRNQVRL